MSSWDEWRGDGNPRDLVRVTFTCERWVLNLLEEAIGEDIERSTEDGDPQLMSGAAALEEIDLRSRVETIASNPPPPGALWSWRTHRYSGDVPGYTDAT